MLRSMLKQTVIATLVFAALAAGWQLTGSGNLSLYAAEAFAQSRD